MSNVIKIKETNTGVSVLGTLAEIKDFVRYWLKRRDDLEGFDVRLSKHKGKSYVLAKDVNFMPVGVLPIHMDYANPIERPLIANAIHEAIHQKSMTAEAMEDEMVCKIEKHEKKHEH